jgi:hypothetical protein
MMTAGGTMQKPEPRLWALESGASLSYRIVESDDFSRLHRDLVEAIADGWELVSYHLTDAGLPWFQFQYVAVLSRPAAKH